MHSAGGQGQNAGLSIAAALPDRAFKLLDEACLGKMQGAAVMPPGLLHELQGIGCFQLDGPTNPIALYSTRCS